MVVFLLLGVLQARGCWASEGDAGTSSAQFLKLGLGARALAMGGAFAGLADDVTALYWNPAGLAGLDGRELSFTHQSLFQNVSYEFAVFAQPVGEVGVLAGGVSYLHMDQLQGRDELGDFTSEFTSSDVGLTLGLGLEAGNSLLLGASIKYLNQTIEDYSAHALAFDLGWLYRIPGDRFRVGGIIQNLGHEMKFVSESYALPRVLKLGVAYSDSLARGSINVVTDVYVPSDDRNSLHLGTEYTYGNLVAARMGYDGSSDLGSRSKLSFGAGLIFSRAHTCRLDYCFLPQGDLGESHTISLLFHF